MINAREYVNRLPDSGKVIVCTSNSGELKQLVILFITNKFKRLVVNLIIVNHLILN
jgi:archaellum biogenesis ATPase FlaH